MWIMVAGPYRSGARTPEEAAQNLEALNLAAYEVFRLGHLPVIGVNLALPIVAAAGESRYDDLVMPISLAAAERCDAILRVGGPSGGADQEVERFRKRGLPVYFGLDELRNRTGVQPAAPAGGAEPLAVVDHVAVLVASVEAALARLAPLAHPAGPIQEFPGEGTRECYVGPDSSGSRLLLMEAAGRGPYADAFKKRGPGLHHVALAVPDCDRYIASLAGSGWYLLPMSLQTLRDTGTAWLARPGVPTLLEVMADASWEARQGAEAVVDLVEMPVPASHLDLFPALGAARLGASADRDVWLTIRGNRLRPANFGS